MNYPVIELALVSASLVVALTCTVLVYFMWRKGAARLDQISNSGALLVKASCHNTKQLRELETSLRHVHDNGLETLAFQKKATDHQRVLLASLTLQTQRIADMLNTSGGGNPPATREAPVRGPAKLASIPAAGATRTRVIGAPGNQPVGVVPLETWIARSRNAGPQSEVDRPQAARPEAVRPEVVRPEVIRQEAPGAVELMSQRFDRLIDEIGKTAEAAVREQGVPVAQPARVAANG